LARDSIGLAPETQIEVIALKNGKAYKSVMTYGKALKLDKKPGFVYRFFQINFSQFKTE
jgi:hypothetical protein